MMMMMMMILLYYYIIQFYHGIHVIHFTYLPKYNKVQSESLDHTAWCLLSKCNTSMRKWEWKKTIALQQNLAQWKLSRFRSGHSAESALLKFHYEISRAPDATCPCTGTAGSHRETTENWILGKFSQYVTEFSILLICPVLYLHSSGSVRVKHNLFFHCYADNVQIFSTILTQWSR